MPEQVTQEDIDQLRADFAPLRDALRDLESDYRNTKQTLQQIHDFRIPNPLDVLSQRNIKNLIVLPIICRIEGTAAATTGNYGTFFTADRPCRVIGFSENHHVAGTDGGNVTLQLEKLTPGTPKGSGFTLLNAALSLKTTADTPQFATMLINSSSDNLTMARGDRLGLVNTGVFTSLDTVTAVAYIQLL